MNKRPAPASATQLLEAFDELANLIQHAKPVFMSQDIRLDKETLLGLVDEVRAAMPTAVEQSDALLRAAQAELEAAKRSGEETIQVARQRALELVEQEQIVIEAHGRANQIIVEAQVKAARLERDADEYCDARLAAFGNDLAQLTAQVEAGRARLAERLLPDSGRPRWDETPKWPESP